MGNTNPSHLNPCTIPPVKVNVKANKPILGTAPIILMGTMMDRSQLLPVPPAMNPIMVPFLRSFLFIPPPPGAHGDVDEFHYGPDTTTVAAAHATTAVPPPPKNMMIMSLDVVWLVVNMLLYHQVLNFVKKILVTQVTL